MDFLNGNGWMKKGKRNREYLITKPNDELFAFGDCGMSGQIEELVKYLKHILFLQLKPMN